MDSAETICARHIRPSAPIPTGVAPDLSKMQRFSAMLFDVYGTLLISGAGDIGFMQGPAQHVDDLQDLLQRYGINCTPDHLAGFLRLNIERIHADQRRKGIDDPEVDIVEVWRQVLGVMDIVALKEFALEYELIVNPVYPMPGLKDLLSAGKTSKMPMGIISNAQFYTVFLLEWFAGAALEKQGLDRRLLFFSWREGHAKPSTVMFNRAKAVLFGMGIPASSALVVGNDMRNDILPAKAVGFKAALFAGDRRSLRRSECDNHGRDIAPDLIITDLRQLIAGVDDP